jgi:hypothetical protein
MRRRIVVAIAATLSLLALIFWEMRREATAKTATPAPVLEYVLSDHSYLPIRNLEPVW